MELEHRPADRRGLRRTIRTSVAAFALGLALGQLGIPRGAASAGSPAALPPEVPAAERVRLREVTDAATVSTRVEAPPFAARRDVFEYLLDHPEFATHVTRALRLARYRIWRTPEGLELDDGWGARGRFEVAHAGTGIRIVHVRGQFEPWLLPSVSAEAVILIEYAARPGADGTSQIATVISAFVKLANPVLAVAGRATGSLASAKAELEARRLGKVFARTTRAIRNDPAGVSELLRLRAGVPRQDLEEFRQLLNLPRTSTP